MDKLHHDVRSLTNKYLYGLDMLKSQQTKVDALKNELLKILKDNNINELTIRAAQKRKILVQIKKNKNIFLKDNSVYIIRKKVIPDLLNILIKITEIVDLATLNRLIEIGKVSPCIIEEITTSSESEELDITLLNQEPHTHVLSQIP